jgi:hypothetical protein
MDPSILVAVIGALSSLIATLLAALSTVAAARLGYKSRQRERAQSGNFLNYREKMEKLSADLARASSEVDKTLEEMTTVSRVREEALKSLELKLDELSKREKEMQARVDTLKQVSLPAVQYFLEATEKTERRSAARDYILFASGVVVSTVVTIILKVFLNI